MEIEFSDKELKALKQEYASQATDSQFLLWIETCKRRGLVPVEDVVLQLRSVREYDEVAKAKIYVKKVVFITTLRALLKLAERTGKYKGFVTSQYIYLDDKKQPTIVSEFPLPDPNSIDKPLIPWAAKAGVKREGFDEPQYEVARFWAYAQTFDDDGKKKLNSTWTTRGPEQLVKCARAAALRGSFPEELGGLFLEEEIHNEDVVTPKPDTKAEPTKSVAPAVTPAAPQANHAPAEGKVAPRPGEKPKEIPPAPAVQATTTPITETAKLPEYTPPLTVETKIEHNRQSQEALNKATAPAATPAPEATKPPAIEKKKRAAKKKDEPKADPLAMTASQANAQAATAPTEAAKPAEVPAPTDVDRVPTQEEFSSILSKLVVVFRDRLGGAGSEGSQHLKQFILKQSNQTDTKLITSKQWANILKVLNSALDDADLKSIVSK